MIEIALCLAIIGFALLSILIVLPGGMNTQRDTREETIIGQDASELIEAIRTGARGDDDLTNYVYAITNYVSYYNTQGKLENQKPYLCVYTYNSALLNGAPDTAMCLTNGLRIIGLLSTPEFTAGNSLYGGPPLTSLAKTYGQFYTSNHIVALVHSFSGLAAEKPPQNNELMQGDTFSYRLICVNAPMALDTNAMWMSGNLPDNVLYSQQLANSLRELRLLFEWPQLPNGDVGKGRQNFRLSIAGQLVMTNYGNYFAGIEPLYFYQSQSFTNAP